MTILSAISLALDQLVGACLVAGGIGALFGYRFGHLHGRLYQAREHQRVHDQAKRWGTHQ